MTILVEVTTVPFGEVTCCDEFCLASTIIQFDVLYFVVIFQAIAYIAPNTTHALLSQFVAQVIRSKSIVLAGNGRRQETVSAAHSPGDPNGCWHQQRKAAVTWHAPVTPRLHQMLARKTFMMIQIWVSEIKLL